MRKLPKTLDYYLSLNPKIDLNHALEVALEYGELESIHLLIEKGANPNLERSVWKALHYGPESHRLAIIKSQKFDKKSPYWVQMAAKEGRIETLQELIKIGANLNGLDEGNRTPLMLAIENGKDEIAKILIGVGVDTEVRSRSGYGSLTGETALCLASRKGNLEIVKKLVAAKADVNANCNSVESAAKAGNREVVEALVAGGADLKDRYTGHWRALFATAELDKNDIAEILARGGVRVDVRDEMDSTPLMIAASKGSLNMIRFLVKQGANLAATNSQRPLNDVGSNFIGTPLGWAIEYKQDAAASLLRELGANK